MISQDERSHAEQRGDTNSSSSFQIDCFEFYSCLRFDIVHYDLLGGGVRNLILCEGTVFMHDYLSSVTSRYIVVACSSLGTRNNLHKETKSIHL